mmetsp:Transcript_18789/g.23397  ORF Transcript_18789/g.23397 Transcript_18789/m.23397 type:complete len:81 (+) Transcript_18789:408-650(+)
MQNVSSLLNQQVLYNAFIQDSIEFLMVLMVPTERNVQLESFEDLLPRDASNSKQASFSLPDWLVPLVKVSYFLHFFREEM